MNLLMPAVDSVDIEYIERKMDQMHRPRMFRAALLGSGHRVRTRLIPRPHQYESITDHYIIS